MKQFLFPFVLLTLAVLQLEAVTPYDVITSGGFVQPFAPRIISAPQDTPLAHPAVVENAAAESQLPPELLNSQYKNPAIAERLAKESWFTDKEFPVHHREADKISREEIYKVIMRLQH